MYSKAISFFLSILTPLALGALLYAVYRTKELTFFKWLPWEPVERKPASWVLYNLPDFLWLFALLQSLRLVWLKGNILLAWCLLSLCLSFLSEGLQWLHVIPGTFDWLDMLAYTLAFLFVILHISITKSISHEHP